MARINHEIPYVEKNGKAIKYRRVIPKDVRLALATAAKPNGPTAWIKTFPARTPLAEIEQYARRLAAEQSSLIARARNGEVLGPEIIAEAEEYARDVLKDGKSNSYDLLSMFPGGKDSPPTVRALMNALENDGRYVPDVMSLTASLERDKQIYGKGRDEKPIEYSVKSLVGLIGDKGLTSVTRADVSQWLSMMAAEGKAPSTIRRRVGALRAMVNRAFLDMDYNGRNPFEKHKIEGGAGRSSDRLPLNQEMLARIDSYLTSSSRLGHETVNLYRLLKGTGAGPAEIGGLVHSDVQLDAQIPYVWIRANALRGIKADVRDRLIPLIGDTLEAAKDAHKRMLVRSKGKDPDETPLFESFDGTGRGADSISGKLNAMIRRAGVPKSKRLTVYSLRHTMKEALRSAGVADHVQRRMLGHTGHGVADRYGSPTARLAEVRDAITNAMDHFGDVDSAIYSANERIEGS